MSHKEYEKLLDGLTPGQRKHVSELMDILRVEMGKGVKCAITELQILEADLAEKDFKLADPQFYTNAQVDFMRPYIKAFSEALQTTEGEEHDE